MTTSTVRSKFAAFAVKLETLPGQDAIGGTPATGDWVLGEIEWDYDPQTIENPEITGSLDRAPGIVGGLRPRLRIRVPLRGSGGSMPPPDWGKLMQCCAYSETLTPAPIGAPTAAVAGTQLSITAGAPFGTTPNQYRGMPLLASGDQTFTTAIIGYTGAKVIFLGEMRAVAPTTATLIQIPVHNLYAPTSDEAVYKTCTIYAYVDGYNWRFGGCVGTWSLELTTGGIGMLTFEMRGQMLAKTGAALPTGWNTVIRPAAPRFVAGRAQLNYVLARCRSLTFNAGVGVTLPDNPEAIEGYDPAVPIERASGGSIDPLKDTVNGTQLYDNFRSGAGMSLFAVVGSMPGNRFIITAPNVRAQGMRHGQREGLMTDEIPFACSGVDSALYLAAF
jgi:hypothetical protein